MRRTLALIFSVALVAAACGDDTDGADGSPATSSTLATATTDPVDDGAVDTTTSAEPTTTTTTTTTPPVAQAPFSVAASTRTLVDDSRTTRRTASSDELPSRTFDVWLDVPDTDGPVPLVVFAHGITGHPRNHELLRTHLAEQGFVVAAPAFPLTNGDVTGSFLNIADVDEQPGDVSFLIDTLLADPDLAERIDPDRIGMIGHSLGGLTTAGTALNPDGDSRISVAVVMSAGFVEARDGVDVLVIHGDQDRVVPYLLGQGGYGVLDGRRMFMTLVGGDHNRGIGDDDSEVGATLRGVAGAFFAESLDADTGQIDSLDDLIYDEVTIEAATAAGPLDDWRDYFSG